MKKVVGIFFLLLLALSGVNTAMAEENPVGVTFIYINGSNNLTLKNRDKFRVDFLESVEKL